MPNKPEQVKVCKDCDNQCICRNMWNAWGDDAICCLCANEFSEVCEKPCGLCEYRDLKQRIVEQLVPFFVDFNEVNEVVI